MQHLLQTRVLLRATTAATLSTLAAYPRFSLWPDRPIPIWYLEATIFICSIVLWGFVFAWHTPYTHRPVFRAKWHVRDFTVATLVGLGFDIGWRLWTDPALKGILPGEFPGDWNHWLASVLFLIGFSQLFLTFATFDWLMRLLHRQWVAILLTALLGVGVVAMKLHSQTTGIPQGLLVVLLVARFIGGLLTVIFYLRGGLLLAWWWAFLLEARHVLDFL